MKKLHYMVFSVCALAIGCGTTRVARVIPTATTNISQVPLLSAKEAEEKWTAKGFSKFIGFQGSFVNAEW